MSKDIINIGELMSLCKANSHTYYNLDEESKRNFRKLYNHINKNKDLYIKWNMQETMRLKKILSNPVLLEYVNKYRALEYINGKINGYKSDVAFKR